MGRSPPVQKPIAQYDNHTVNDTRKKTNLKLVSKSWIEVYNRGIQLEKLVAAVLLKVDVHSRWINFAIFGSFGIVCVVLLVWFAMSASLRHFFYMQRTLSVIVLLVCLGIVALFLYGVVLLNVQLMARAFLHSLPHSERVRLANELRAVGERVGEPPHTLAVANATEAFLIMCRFAAPEMQRQWGIEKILK